MNGNTLWTESEGWHEPRPSTTTLVHGRIRTEQGDPVRAAELAALRPWIEFATAIVAIFAPPPNDGISEGDTDEELYGS